MEQNASEKTSNKVNWTSVIVYYLIACAISWPFFWWRDMESESWNNLHIPGFVKTWSYMWGPGIAAIICLFIFKGSHQKTINFFGSSKLKSLLFYFVPILALCVPGVEGVSDMNPHLFPLVFSVIGFVSIFGEELGWRGFLQDALRPLTEWKRYTLLAVMWEIWHFTNRMGQGDLPQIIMRVGVFTLVGILLCYLIGRAVDRSKSLIVAVTLHSWVDILFEFNGTGTNIVFCCSLVFWVWMLWKWKGSEIQN